MISNLFPEKIVKTKSDGDGGYFSEVYSFESWLYCGCLTFIIVAALLIAVAPVSGTILFIGYCLNTKNGFSSIALPLLLSTYLVIDAKNHWLITDLSSIIYGSTALSVTFKFGVTTITTSVFAIFFGRWLYNFSHKKNSIFVFFMMAIYLLFHIITLSIF